MRKSHQIGRNCWFFVIADKPVATYPRPMQPVSPSASRSRHVAVVAFDGCQSLDVVGPLEVFAIASRRHAVAHPEARRPPYTTEVLAPAAGNVRANSGLRLVADRAFASVRGGIDTLVVAGGDVQTIVADPNLLGWLRRLAPRTRRIASVCSGAFVLAAAGLLDGKRAATHWSAAERLARMFPSIDVETDAIFVRDGNVYSSAGITAGMDMALALVEEDLGSAAALDVARYMVLFLKRPGGQSQFSRRLAAQAVGEHDLGGLPQWIVDHVDRDLSVETLAARAAMSPRNFARVFTRCVGNTPAKFVEEARLERARQLLEDTDLGLDEVAMRCGFGSAERMRRTFHRHLRVVPHDYRLRFRRQPPADVLTGRPGETR